MSGPLEKFCPKNIMRKWKSYTFKLTDTHLRFYNSWVCKLDTIFFMKLSASIHNSVADKETAR